MRKVVRRGNFTSVENLEERLRQFLDYSSLLNNLVEIGLYENRA